MTTAKKKSFLREYRANIVTYSLAIFHHAIKKKFPADELDLLAIWKAQQMPDVFTEIFKAITRNVNDFITDSKRPIINVTQWCKQEQCWINMKASLRGELPANFPRWLADKNSLKAIKKDAAARKLIANVQESSALKTAMKIPFKIPQPFQCEKLLRLLERLEENGLIYEPDTRQE